MPACIVKGCTNRSSVKSRRQEELEKTMKITLHAFPKCPMKRKLWFNSLGLQNSVALKYPAVCSVHFRQEDLDRTSLVCIRLRENAIPYVKLPEIKIEENFNAYGEISPEEPSTFVKLPEIKIEENFNAYEEISPEEPSTSVNLSEIKIEENFYAYEEISTEEPSTSVKLPEIKIEENFNAYEEFSIEEPSTSVKLSEIKIEENFSAYEEFSTAEPSTSVNLPEIKIEENLSAYEEFSTEEPSTSMNCPVIKVETCDSVGFTDTMSITGGKRRHVENTGSHEVSAKVLKTEPEVKNEHES